MRVRIGLFQRLYGEFVSGGRAGKRVSAWRMSGRGVFQAGRWLALLLLAWMASPLPEAQQINASAQAGAVRRAESAPPRVAQAERFMARRGWTPGRSAASRLLRSASTAPRAESTATGTATWQSLGPTAVTSQNFGLVTGRVSSLALDPSDATGNTLYVGTTGGGVWLSQNAATDTSANISFTALMDSLPALSSVADASISIGALSVQPGGTGVILAGTGDPNDALDSYYGAGILRSADGGTTWSLIPKTADKLYSFRGEGFAGFAWSTANSSLVVAALSQAYEGALVNAVYPNASYQGLYYSTDSGATWSLATIMDGSTEVQGPNYGFVLPDGNAATAVVWNPVRKLFIAAVRYHGYYQSSDGVMWTRVTYQPGTYDSTGAKLTTTKCPANAGETGLTGCPIFRGALAVNPETGDTFAWTVDFDNQDQGLWQDECSATSGECASTALWTSTQAVQWSTAALETSTPLGASTIANGDYNLALAAVPSGQETMLLAGANDLWQTTCPVSQGCAWRNTTNSTSGFCAAVGKYQHALEWNASNPLEIFVGNDSGLWRSTDAIAESGSACSSTDASHFQNLNGGLGSLAEVESIPQVGATPYTMMAGLGANGTAGVKSATGVTADWPEILGGEGGPVAIDPGNSNNWYVNNGAGVSIHRCSQSDACTPDDFGLSAVVTDADVSEDGLTMAAPAPFLVDPLDNSQLLIGTCRVWRGPSSGVGWSSVNAISSMLDGISNSYCSGNALIRSMAAMALPASTALASGGEVVYVGMYGSLDGGATKSGHVMSSTYNSATSAWSTWTDLTPATSADGALNYYGHDISSIFIDTHDTTGNTVYVTVAGISNTAEEVQTVFRSTDGGETWVDLMSNLPASPANSVVVDPQDANTVYVATDAGVYSTREIANCASPSSACWSAFGSGLPLAPVVALSAAPASATVQDLVAATYGRGIWIAPLWTSGEILTTATAAPESLVFDSQAYGSSSSVQTVTLTNTEAASLKVTSIVASGDFSETDSCQNKVVNPDATCAISVTFTPTAVGSRTGALTVYANVTGGELRVALSGAGTASDVFSVTPSTIDFGGWEVGATSKVLQVTVNNSNSSAMVLTSAISGPFAIATSGCGSSVAAESSCNLTLTFTPVAAGAATGALTLTDANGTQTVALSGTGLAAATDALSPTSLTFADIVVGQLSTAQTVTLTNSGGVSLTSIAISVSGAFQQTNNCTACLAANSSCAISVQFDPTAIGAQTGALIVKDALQTQTLALGGTGIAAPALSVSPTSLSFTGQAVGVASATHALTVSNTGGAALANVGFQITGASAASFSTGTTTCGAALAAGSSCTVPDLHSRGGGLEHSHAGDLLLDLRREGGQRATDGHGAEFVRAQRQPLANCLFHRDSRPVQRLPDGDRHQQQRGGQLADAYGHRAFQTGQHDLRRDVGRRGKLYGERDFLALSLHFLRGHADRHIVHTGLFGCGVAQRNGRRCGCGHISAQYVGLRADRGECHQQRPYRDDHQSRQRGQPERAYDYARTGSGVQSGEHDLRRDAGASGQLHGECRVYARQRGRAQRRADGQRQRADGRYIAGALGDGLRLQPLLRNQHGDLLDHLQPDGCQRPESQLYDDHCAARRRFGRVYACLRHAAFLLFLYLQPLQSHRFLNRVHR
jgi:hypothetical protein